MTRVKIRVKSMESERIVLTAKGARIPWGLVDSIAQAQRDLTCYIKSGPPNASYKSPVYFYVKCNDGLLVPIQYVLMNDQWMFTVVDSRPEPKPFRGIFTGMLRDTQAKIVSRALRTVQRNGGTLLSMPTGSGKTICALQLLCQLKVKPLILVHKTFLLDQWRERIHEFVMGARVSVIQGTVNDTTGDIVIGMLQTFHTRQYECPKDIGVVIVDECHHIPAKTYRFVMMKMNCRYRIGLSATPYRIDGLDPTLLLGPLTSTEETLPTSVSPGIYSSFDFDGKRIIVQPYSYNCAKYRRSPPMMKNGDTVNHAAMLNIVAEDDLRTSYIASIIASLGDRNILCLVHRKEHRARLQDYLTRRSIESSIFSPVSQGCPDDKCVISTFAYASEGFDEKRFDTLLLCSPSSEVRQAVGRILRKMDDPSHCPLVIDVVDNWGVFLRQYQKRKMIYDSIGCTIGPMRDISIRFLPEV